MTAITAFVVQNAAWLALVGLSAAFVLIYGCLGIYAILCALRDENRARAHRRDDAADLDGSVRVLHIDRNAA